MIVGVGIEIVELDDLHQRVIAQPHMCERVFTKDERAYCEASLRPLQHFAARFAAKAAAFKAIGTGSVTGGPWTEIEVVAEVGSQPRLRLRGELRRRARELGATSFHVSLTQSGAYAAAVVVLTR